MSEKECNVCHQIKPLDNFRNQARGKFGKRSQCRSCEYLKHKERYLDKPELRREIEKKYRKNNPEVFARKDKKYYEANKEKHRANSIQWRKDNPEQNAELNRRKEHVRRARKFQNGSEPYTEKQMIDTYGLLCNICKEPINFVAPRKVGVRGWERGLHIDHVVPLSKGGADTLANIRPTHGLCNLQKSNSHDTIDG